MFVFNKNHGLNKEYYIVIDEEYFSEEDVALTKEQIPDMSMSRIVIERHMALKDPSFFERVCKSFPGIDVFVKVDDVEYDVNYKFSQIFNREEMTRLFENNNIINKYGGNLYLSGYTYGDDPLNRENKIPFNRVVQANARMNNWVDKINNAKVNGKSLTPFEKYLYAYQIVTQFKYTADEIFEARDISRVLSSKFIVCAGYSAILSELCRRVGIICKRQYIHSDENVSGANINHEGCILQLKDPKYGIDGFFIADPTLDSFDSSIEEETSITYALMNIDEYNQLFDFNEHILVDNLSDFSNFYFLRDAKEIPYQKTFSESETMINDVSDALKNGYFDEKITTFLNHAINEIPIIEGGYDKAFNFFDKIYLVDRPYTIDEIAKSEELLAYLAMQYYSLSVFDKDTNTRLLRDFFENSVNRYLENKYMNKQEDQNEKDLQSICIGGGRNVGSFGVSRL